jgi:hypothetical protein
MHVSNRRGESIDSGCVNELLRLLGRCQALESVLRLLVDFRARSYIAYLSLRQDGWIDRLNRFNRFLRASHILFERQRGEIDHYRIKPSFRRFHGFCQ